MKLPSCFNQKFQNNCQLLFSRSRLNRRRPLCPYTFPHLFVNLTYMKCHVFQCLRQRVKNNHLIISQHSSFLFCSPFYDPVSSLRLTGKHFEFRIWPQSWMETGRCFVFLNVLSPLSSSLLVVSVARWQWHRCHASWTKSWYCPPRTIACLSHCLPRSRANIKARSIFIHRCRREEVLILAFTNSCRLPFGCTFLSPSTSFTSFLLSVSHFLALTSIFHSHSLSPPLRPFISVSFLSVSEKTSHACEHTHTHT